MFQALLISFHCLSEGIQPSGQVGFELVAHPRSKRSTLGWLVILHNLGIIDGTVSTCSNFLSDMTPSPFEYSEHLGDILLQL